MRAYERLLRYARVWTTSDPENEACSPSAERELDLARILVEEMKRLGIGDAGLDENGYVTGHIPATPGLENRTKLGFIAHMDTAPDASGKDVRPQIHEHYDGKAVALGDGKVLDPADFPELTQMKGKTLITTDGTTLLGADDKAGIAEILTLVETLRDQKLPHGPLSIAFTPDEEIGSEAHLFNLKQFGADYAYTVDGGATSEITYENFNAAGAQFEIRGVSVHTGSAKDLMINAGLVACEINAMLPAADIPRLTEGREGFFHLESISGTVEKAEVSYLVRDHSEGHFQARLDLLRHIEKTINEKYGEGTVKLTIKQQYRNMEEKIRPCMHLVENARKAISALGITPDSAPVRGGTDGAALSFRGLPCPNLGTGGYGFHGPFEHITAEDMDDEVKILTGIVASYAEPREG